MFDFDHLTEEQFIRPATLEAVKYEALDLITHLMAPESKQLAEQLERKINSFPDLKIKMIDIYQQYQALIIYLKLTALPCLDNDAVSDLIKNNFLYSFDAGLDLNERMTGKMYSVPVLVWPEYAEQLIGTLKQNSQKLGQQPIIIAGEASPATPTIKNWLSDYDRTLGPEKIDDLKREEYLARNQNAKLLNEEDKSKLRNVLQFYDNLKPIPLSEINAFFKQIGVDKEIEKEIYIGPPAPTTEPMSYTPLPQFKAPSSAPLQTPLPAPKSPYLEPIETAEPLRPPQRPSYPEPQRPIPPEPPRPTPPPYAPPPRPVPPPQTSPTSPYLEPIDIPEPKTPQSAPPPPPPSAPPVSSPPPPQPPPKSEPRLEGNIVDLKNLDQ